MQARVHEIGGDIFSSGKAAGHIRNHQRDVVLAQEINESITQKTLISKLDRVAHRLLVERVELHATLEKRRVMPREFGQFQCIVRQQIEKTPEAIFIKG